MNSPFTAPGFGGAIAVLIGWYLDIAFGLKPSAEVTAAIASVATGFFTVAQAAFMRWMPPKA